MAKTKKPSLVDRYNFQSQFIAEGKVEDPETGTVVMWLNPNAAATPEERERLIEKATWRNRLSQPVSVEEAMDRYFVEETKKSKRDSGTYQQILDRAGRLHPEWPCPGSIQGVRKRIDKYREEHKMGPRPQRKHKRK